MMGLKERTFGPLPPVTLEDLVPPEHFNRHLERTRPIPATPPDPAAGTDLTPRELEVLRLVAAGRSNAQVAEALFIRPGTDRTHTSPESG